MEILEAFDLTRCPHSAADLAGCDPKTVTRYVTSRDEGADPNTRVRRPMLVDRYRDKIEELVERSGGRVRADIVHERLCTLDPLAPYAASERTTRRAVRSAKAAFRAGRRRTYRPWITEPGMWLQFDWGAGPVIAGRPTLLFCSARIIPTRRMTAARLGKARVVVADDQPDTVQTTLDEPADEGRPGRPLVVAGAELEAQDAALAGVRHAGRDEGRHGHDPAGLADLDVRSVKPQVRIRLCAERAAAKGGDLGVEGRADPAHLALADGRDAQGAHEVVDPAGADALYVGLLDDRQEGPLGAPPGLEQGREVRAVANPRDGQIDRPDAGVPAPLAIAVPVGQPTLRVALAVGYPGQPRHLGLHECLGEDADALAQDVDVTIRGHLAERLEQGHIVVGHRCGPPCRRFPTSNDARMTRWPFHVSAISLLHQL